MPVIANIKYNKTTFTDTWKKIVNDHRVGDRLVTRNLEFVRGALKLTSKWKHHGYAAHFKAKIGNLEFGPKGKTKKVKGIMFICQGLRKYIFVSQSDILKELFPPQNDSEVGKKNRAEVLKMMRQQIQYQIDDFKEQWQLEMDLLRNKDVYEYHEAMKCPLSGKDLRKSEIAIDHDVPFITLAKEFWRINNINPYKVFMVGGAYDRKFEQDHLNLAWQKYHEKHAKLQAVERKANLSKNKKSTEEYLKEVQKAQETINPFKKNSPRVI